MKYDFEDKFAALRRVTGLIDEFADAAYLVLDKKAHDAAEAAGWPDKEPDGGDEYKVLDASGVEVFEYEVETATLNAIYPQIRDLLAKQNPEAWAHVLKGEAEAAAEEAEREAEAKAAGFESYEAQQEAKAKARRSEAAQRGAETRKAMREGGYPAVHALNKKRAAEREAAWQARQEERAKAQGFASYAEMHAAQEAEWEAQQANEAAEAAAA